MILGGTGAPHRTPRSDAKKAIQKVRSEGCFAVHLLLFSCARFGRMVCRDCFEAGAIRRIGAAKNGCWEVRKMV